MTSQQILQSDLLDILFEHRNKMYGAYALRKNYPLQLIKAMGITVLLVLALLFFGNTSATKTKTYVPKDTITLTSVVLPGEQKPELPKPKLKPTQMPQQVKTEIFTTQIQAVERTEHALATQTDLSMVAIGSDRIDGPPSPGLQPPQLPPVNSGNGNADVPVEKIDPPLPSRQPQFPGGATAWMNFLNKHLRPPQDLEPGEKRMCLIRFSVDEEGLITNFQVAQSGGNEFDSEVIRVLKKMPKWLPAIQAGKPIAVSFTQPVTFAAAEE